jgi:DNA-binding MarR family transcriptional regulator
MQPHESLAHSFGVMARLMERELRSACAEYHVLPGQLPVLLALYEHDGQTQTELADVCGVEQPTMAATLRRMEDDGLVRRAPDPGDGRRVAVLLTAPARRMDGQLQDAVRQVNRRALRGLSGSERTLLYSLPDRLRTNVGRR